MNNYIAHHCILALAQVAELLAMRAENESRADKGLAQAYGEESFLLVRDELERLAHSVIQF